MNADTAPDSYYSADASPTLQHLYRLLTRIKAQRRASLTNLYRAALLILYRLPAAERPAGEQIAHELAAYSKFQCGFAWGTAHLEPQYQRLQLRYERIRQAKPP